MGDKVSIIVPIYNVEPYLKRCMDSLLRQTYQNIEILLVDDCSTDCSAEIARGYAKAHPDVCRFVQREKNGGLSAARNTGMRESTGTWLAFVDSDDWVTDDYISSMYEVAQRDNADIVMSSVYYYYSEKDCKEASPFGNLTTASSHKEKVALSRSYAATRMFKRELFFRERLEFPEDIWRGEDIATIIPLLCKTDRISLIQRPMYYYFQRPTSLSNKNIKNIDISFYPKAVNRMLELSPAGFEEELEFRAISELMYGMVMIMIRSGREKDEIYQHINWFESKFPEWRSNPYLTHLPRGKKVFIDCAAGKKYILLKVLIWLWDQSRKF